MWAILSTHCPGTVKTTGAFYFLAKLPPHVTEEEAVHTLATQHRVLCTPGKPTQSQHPAPRSNRLVLLHPPTQSKTTGSAFGAPGHLRLSYGSLPEEECLAAVDRLEAGLKGLSERGKKEESK